MDYKITRKTKDILSGLYGVKTSDGQAERYEALLEQVCRDFGHTPDEVRFFSSPGRCEIIGNHTDHQCGCVMTAAVDVDTIAAVVPRDDGTVRLASEGFGRVDIDLAHLEADEGEKNTTASIIRGVCACTVRAGYAIGGFDACVSSRVPAGSGLSSSASFEVLIADVLSVLYNENRITPLEKALISREAENVYFGKPCGLEDQLAIALGGLSFIDFGDPLCPLFEKVDEKLLSGEYDLCVTNTGGSHSDLSDEYAAVPEDMTRVANSLGCDRMRRVSPEVFFEALPSLKETFPHRALLRAYHFIKENERSARAKDLIKQGDISGFLSLVSESGRSSYMYLQNVYVSGEVGHQEMSLALALSEHILDGRGAFRLQGGGFAGTVIAFVPGDLTDKYLSIMESVFGKGSVSVLRVRNCGAVCLDN